MDAVIARLCEELEANRSMFVALCTAAEDRFAQSIADDQWSVGEQVAHIAAFDQIALHHLAPTVATLPPGAKVDGDAWNGREVRRRAGRTRQSLVGEMAERRAECDALLTRLPAKELRRSVRFPGDARRSAGRVPLRLWLEQWSKHDMIHGRAILQATSGLPGESDFENWLRDDPVLEALERTASRSRGAGES